MKTESHRWIKFWPQDWQRDPALRICGLSARGLWMELMCLAHDGFPYGYVTVNGRAPTVKQVGLLVGVSETEAATLLDELETAGVFSRDDNGVIFSRRMVRDKAVRDAASKNGKQGGNPQLTRKDNKGVNPNDKDGVILQEADIKKERTEAIASDARASGDDLFPSKPAAEPTVWNEGIDKLVRLGVPDTKARSFVGKMVKALGKDNAAALDLVRECPDTRDPLSWISAALRNATKPQVPCLNDDAEAWGAYADPGEAGWSIDSRNGKKHPVCGGYYFDVAAGLVGDALGLRQDVRYDWGTLAEWMRAHDLHDHILPILKDRASWKGYQRPDKLKFFDNAIKNGSVRRAA